MSNRLVTIATFHDTLEAAVVKNFLDGQGIPAELADEDTVATNWSLAGAIGGIKLQVAPIHVERAEMLIEQVREDRQAAHDEPALPQTAIAAQEIAEEMQEENEDKAPVNKLVDRLFRATVFGLIFWPLQLYALYLLFQLIGEREAVSPRRRWKVWASVLLSLPLLAILYFAATYSWAILIPG